MEDNGNLQLYQAGYYRYDTFTKLEYVTPCVFFQKHDALFFILFPSSSLL